MSCRLATCVLVIGLSSCASTPSSTPPPAVKGPEVETPEVETLEFKVEIAASVEKVWDTMPMD